MTEISETKTYRSLSNKIIVHIFVLVSLTVLILGVINYYRMKKTYEADLDNIVELMIQRLKTNLLKPIWSSDIQAIENTISAEITGMAADMIIENKIGISVIRTSYNMVLIKVTDNGIGISQENLTKVFHYGFITKKEGPGFGLHSCSNAAKALGGEITVESPRHLKGATFTLHLPMMGLTEG